ncbi:hypothetical protein JR316_0007350 [Psilocybe cubensis]|uniref:Transmembrane protein n=2 Tax=Psilocybe cubensis TaxID=181762 RepID=A0A8H7XP14_PSICU|nr:hypothetical protein JR316_0007350 [Psilocybe cubensis]KAH9480750.1 hypothetical protein JR316_0007350 [Psilocybe cubensis]
MYIGAASYASLFATAFSGSGAVPQPSQLPLPASLSSLPSSVGKLGSDVGLGSVATVLRLDEETGQMQIDKIFHAVWAFILSVFDVVKNWAVCWGPSLDWISEALSTSYTFVQNHPHPFHILGWTVFFGPIIVLIPCLLLVELVIIVIFHLESFLHGQSGETIPDRLDFLKDYFIETRESVFATVERWTAAFNQKTVAHPALLGVRLLGALLGGWVLAGIWSGW